MAVTGVLPVEGQRLEVRDSLGRKYLISPVRAPWPPYRKEHELRVTVGAFPMNRENVLSDWNSSRWWNFYHPDHPADQLERAKVYYGAEYTTGAYALEYAYRVSRRFWVGASLSYAGFSHAQYSVASHMVLGRRKEHQVTALFSVRVVWRAWKWGHIYSGAAIGPQWLQARDYDVEWENLLRVGYQATFFGVTYGGRWCCFAEVGVGAHGILVGGIGYRFGADK